MMDSDFKVVIASDVELLEELYAELQYKQEAVVVITQEEGFESLDVELWPRRDAKPWKFKLKDFEQAMEMAKKRLWEFRRNSE